jgi:hypothetical protein
MDTIGSSAARGDLWRNAESTDTWHSIVMRALAHCDGTASLQQLYELIATHPKAEGKAHVRAKLRQVLERSSVFVRVDSGVWSLASNHSADEIEKLEALRHERYPRKTKPTT